MHDDLACRPGGGTENPLDTPLCLLLIVVPHLWGGIAGTAGLHEEEKFGTTLSTPTGAGMWDFLALTFYLMVGTAGLPLLQPQYANASCHFGNTAGLYCSGEDRRVRLLHRIGRMVTKAHHITSSGQEPTGEETYVSA